MRILAITNLYPNPFQPQRAPFNRHQLRLLGQSHPLRVIAPIAWTDELAARRNGAAALPKDRVVALDGLTVEHPRYWFSPRLWRSAYGRFYRWSIKRAFRRALAEFRPEIVFAPWVYPDGWAAVRLARPANLPVVIQSHGSDVLLLDQFPARKKRTIEALRAADGVVAVSQDIANRLLAYGVAADRLRVVYDGVDSNVFSPGNKAAIRERLGVNSDGPLLLFIGNLVPVKAVDVLLDACSLLKQSEPKFQLVVIGAGPLRPALEDQAARLGIARRVRFLGSLPQQQLPDWYRAADLFVLPSHSEGVPNVLLEASACRTPYVASRVGGIPEIAHLGQSLLVPPNKPPLLAEAMRQALGAAPATDLPRMRDRSEAVAELSSFFDRIQHLPRNVQR